MPVNKAFSKFMDNGADRALWAEKANLYPEKVSIPVRTKHRVFHDGRDPLSSTCLSWFPQVQYHTVHYWSVLLADFL